MWKLCVCGGRRGSARVYYACVVCACMLVCLCVYVPCTSCKEIDVLNSIEMGKIIFCFPSSQFKYTQKMLNVKNS